MLVGRCPGCGTNARLETAKVDYRVAYPGLEPPFVATLEVQICQSCARGIGIAFNDMRSKLAAWAKGP
jgi:hypothetical protein